MIRSVAERFGFLIHDAADPDPPARIILSTVETWPVVNETGKVPPIAEYEAVSALPDAERFDALVVANSYPPGEIPAEWQEKRT